MAPPAESENQFGAELIQKAPWRPLCLSHFPPFVRLQSGSAGRNGTPIWTKSDSKNALETVALKPFFFPLGDHSVTPLGGGNANLDQINLDQI